jgi:glycosyltransferase involved in cell wall biosynthesis
MVAALKERSLVPGRTLWVSRLEMAQYIPLAKSLGYRIVLDEHHVESERMMDQAVLSPRGWLGTFSAWQASRLEDNYAELADHLVTATELAASRLRKSAPRAKITVIPTTIDAGRFSAIAPKPGKTLLFSGLLNRPANLEALEWFGHEILPRLRARLGTGLPEIVVAGSSPTSKLIVRLQEWNIRVHADPLSIHPLLEEAAIVFLPIRAGDAAHLRILEAMAAGRPVVTTGKGAAGLLLTPTVDAFVAETPDAFAMALVRLLENRDIFEQIRTNALTTAQSRYDISRTDQLLAELSLV